MQVATSNRIATAGLALAVVLAGLLFWDPSIASDASAQPFVALLGHHAANAIVFKCAVCGSMAVAGFPHDDLLLTEVQAAELLGLSVRTLQSWRLRGQPKFLSCAVVAQFGIGVAIFKPGSRRIPSPRPRRPMQRSRPLEHQRSGPDAAVCAGRPDTWLVVLKAMFPRGTLRAIPSR